MERVRTVKSPEHDRQQKMSLESERLALPQAKRSGNILQYPSFDSVMKIVEILFDKESTFASFSAKAYNVEGTIEITGKIQTLTLFFSDTGAGPKRVLDSIVTSSWRN